MLNLRLRFWMQEEVKFYGIPGIYINNGTNDYSNLIMILYHYYMCNTVGVILFQGQCCICTTFM